MSYSSHNLLLDALKEKIGQTKDDLTRYKEDYAQYQKILSLEIEHRSHAEAETMKLQIEITRLNNELFQQRTQLDTYISALREAQAAFNESARLRKTMEHRVQMQSEQIELLSWELTKTKRQLADSDRLAQESSNCVNKLTEQLTECEQKLDQSEQVNASLKLELSEATKNMSCVELAAERSAKQSAATDQKLCDLQRRLRENEMRAMRAETGMERLQHSNERILQRYQQQLRDLGIFLP